MRTLTIGATAACMSGSVMLSCAIGSRPPFMKHSVVPSPTAWGLNGYSLVLSWATCSRAGPRTPCPAPRERPCRRAVVSSYKRYQLLDAEWMLCCTGFNRCGQGPRPDGPMPMRRHGSATARFSLHFSMRDTQRGRQGGARRAAVSTARAEFAPAMRGKGRGRRVAYTHQKQADVGVASERPAAVQTRLNLAGASRELQRSWVRRRARRRLGVAAQPHGQHVLLSWAKRS